MSEPDRRPRGRPPGKSATSREAILDAVFGLLQEKTVRDLTMEEVARRAKVGKPTLYRWWPTKASLVLDMLCERMALDSDKPTGMNAEDSLRFRVRLFIDALNGPFGRIVAGVIAEGQGEPAVIEEYLRRWSGPRRMISAADLDRGRSSGELRPDTDPDIINDAIFGAIYYRLLLRSGPLTRRYGEDLVEQVMRGQRLGGSARAE